MPGRWSGTWYRREACSRSWPRTGRSCFVMRISRTCFRRGKGRPSVPASVMASVMVLQVLHDYSDAEAAEAARCDLRWKVACGFPLDHRGFDPPTLVYWRKRLARSGRPHRINEAVRKVIVETGVLKGRRRRAVDSTILADAVATQDTITQLVAAIRRVARVVPG